MAHVHVCAQRSQLLVVLLELAEAPLAIRVFFCGTSSQVGFRRQTPSLPLKTSFRPSSGLDFNPRCHKLLEYFSAYILILFCLFFLTPQAGHGKPMSLTEHRGLFPSTQSLSPSWLREDCQSTGVHFLTLQDGFKRRVQLSLDITRFTFRGLTVSRIFLLFFITVYCVLRPNRL